MVPPPKYWLQITTTFRFSYVRGDMSSLSVANIFEGVHFSPNLINYLKIEDGVVRGRVLNNFDSKISKFNKKNLK